MGEKKQKPAYAVGDFFAVSRPALRELQGRLSSRFAGACMSLMRYFLEQAQHSPTTYGGVELQRGQLLRTRTRIKADTGLSEKLIRKSVHRLSDLHEVQAEPSSRAKSATVYTLLRYDTYDAMRGDWAKQDDESGPSNGPRPGQDRAKTGPYTNKVQRNESKNTTRTVVVLEESGGEKPQLEIVGDLIAFKIDPETAQSLTEAENYDEANLRHILDYAKKNGKGPGFVVDAARKGWTLTETKAESSPAIYCSSPVQRCSACGRETWRCACREPCPHCSKASWRMFAQTVMKDGKKALRCECGKGAWFGKSRRTQGTRERRKGRKDGVYTCGRTGRRKDRRR